MDPSKVNGKYHMVSQEGFDEFLKAVGNDLLLCDLTLVFFFKNLAYHIFKVCRLRGERLLLRPHRTSTANITPTLTSGSSTFRVYGRRISSLNWAFRLSPASPTTVAQSL